MRAVSLVLTVRCRLHTLPPEGEAPSQSSSPVTSARTARLSRNPVRPPSRTTSLSKLDEASSMVTEPLSSARATGQMDTVDGDGSSTARRRPLSARSLSATGGGLIALGADPVPMEQPPVTFSAPAIPALATGSLSGMSMSQPKRSARGPLAATHGAANGPNLMSTLDDVTPPAKRTTAIVSAGVAPPSVRGPAPSTPRRREEVLASPRKRVEMPSTPRKTVDAGGSDSAGALTRL